MIIDRNRLYEVKLKDVKSIWWKPYAKEALRVTIEVPEFLTVTKCTFGIPKSLKPGNNKFSKILGAIFTKTYSDELLKQPEKLAYILSEDLAEKPFKARLSQSSNQEYPINLEALEMAGEG